MRENPFCTRWIRPGALPFVFPTGHSAETLVERLRQNGWCGEIIGPHGSGKSALLATLAPAIERAGQRTLLVELHDGQRRLPISPGREHRLRPFTLLVVDGYEQLARFHRWRLRGLCHRRGWGLLVTGHASVGLPPLFHTEATLAIAGQIVRRLLADERCLFSEEELSDCFARRHGDLREMLFDLYDLFEQRFARPDVRGH